MKAAELEALRAMEAEATAEPWHTCEADGQPWTIEAADGTSIALASQITPVRDDPAQRDRTANAKLIAAMRNALPALLREREELLKALRALRAGHTDRDSHCEICPALMDAAIAKAES